MGAWDDMEDDLLMDGPLPAIAPLPADVMKFDVPCARCNGSGVWRGNWKSFPCNGCGGKGKVQRKSPPEVLVAQREKRAQDKRDSRKAWADEHADVLKWIDEASSWRNPSGYALSLGNQCAAKGSLSEGQVSKVREIIAKQAEKAAAPKVEAPKVNAGAIEEAFARAKEQGIKKPKMNLDKFKFSLAPDHGRNPGALYVCGRDGMYLGMIKGGSLNLNRHGEPFKAEVIAVMEDPKSAAIAYGKKFGECCICSRELSDPVSVEMGIGPICAGRMGWG